MSYKIKRIMFILFVSVLSLFFVGNSYAEDDVIDGEKFYSCNSKIDGVNACLNRMEEYKFGNYDYFGNDIKKLFISDDYDNLYISENYSYSYCQTFNPKIVYYCGENYGYTYYDYFLDFRNDGFYLDCGESIKDIDGYCNDPFFQIEYSGFNSIEYYICYFEIRCEENSNFDNSLPTFHILSDNSSYFWDEEYIEPVVLNSLSGGTSYLNSEDYVDFSLLCDGVYDYFYYYNDCGFNYLSSVFVFTGLEDIGISLPFFSFENCRFSLSFERFNYECSYENDYFKNDDFEYFLLKDEDKYFSYVDESQFKDCYDYNYYDLKDSYNYWSSLSEKMFPFFDFNSSIYYDEFFYSYIFGDYYGDGNYSVSMECGMEELNELCIKVYYDEDCYDCFYFNNEMFEELFNNCVNECCEEIYNRKNFYFGSDFFEFYFSGNPLYIEIYLNFDGEEYICCDSLLFSYYDTDCINELYDFFFVDCIGLNFSDIDCKYAFQDLYDFDYDFIKFFNEKIYIEEIYCDSNLYLYDIVSYSVNYLKSGKNSIVLDLYLPFFDCERVVFEFYTEIDFKVCLLENNELYSISNKIDMTYENVLAYYEKYYKKDGE